MTDGGYAAETCSQKFDLGVCTCNSIPLLKGHVLHSESFIIGQDLQPCNFFTVYSTFHNSAELVTLLFSIGSKICWTDVRLFCSIFCSTTLVW